LEYFLYFLFFVLGYTTCKLLYFVTGTRRGIQIVRLSQLVALAVMARSLENFSRSKYYALSVMKENGESEQNLSAFKYLHTEELDRYKRRSIEEIVNVHGNIFNEVLDFDDWATAMKYLETNKQEFINIMYRSKDD
jgi:hypothetical protein|tara:strand:- start:605 stop:1012 length:408 start_codon:yes stop_codon:yes gene_type:complete